MKLLVICSKPQDPQNRPGPFERTFDSSWAERFIKHLHNDRTFCTGCGDRCVHCRDWRVQDFSQDISGIIRLPSILPELLDDPFAYIPRTLPPHDVVVAIAIHEEILFELPKLISKVGGRALIVPAEAPDWISRWAKGRLRKATLKLDLELAVPKPFCDLSLGTGSTIDNFIEYFQIGKPSVEITKKDGRIEQVRARVSAPCGNSHYVAHNLQGHYINTDLRYKVSHYWHAFPCTASMKSDPELGGDTILHKGGQIHMQSFCKAAGL